MNKTIYISGPITYRPDYKRHFNAMEAKLLTHGFKVLNPAVLPAGLSNDQYMQIDLAMIDAADAVILLPGWEASKGANIEADYAVYTRKPVYLSLEGLLLAEGGGQND